jgi:two-component system, OmpR family, response regulator
MPDATELAPMRCDSQVDEGVAMMVTTRRKHILVVDDDEQFLMALAAILDDKGYATTTTWSGYEALKLLRTRPFDLVMLGDNMPDLGLKDVLRKMRIMSLEPLVMVMQDGPLVDAGGRLLSDGVNGVIAKTAGGAEISRAVRERLESNALAAVGA